jgi:hypothetical protein
MTCDIHEDGAALEQRLSLQKPVNHEMPDENSSGEMLDVDLDPEMERKLLVKLDLAFVPIIMLTYLSCFLDRSNIGMKSNSFLYELQKNLSRI